MIKQYRKQWLKFIMMLNEVVVYLKKDYSINESIWLGEDLTKEQITKAVNKQFKVWYYYDIL